MISVSANANIWHIGVVRVGIGLHGIAFATYGIAALALYATAATATTTTAPTAPLAFALVFRVAFTLCGTATGLGRFCLRRVGIAICMVPWSAVIAAAFAPVVIVAGSHEAAFA